MYILKKILMCYNHTINTIIGDGMKKGKKTFIIILLIIIIAAVALFIYFNKDNKLLNSIFNKKETVTEENIINDNYNGVYKYSESLNQTYNIFPGCVLSSVDQYIVVVNSEYYVYDSSCMGTFFQESGNIEDLNIKADYDRKKYFIEYNNRKYISDTSSLKFENANYALNKIRVNFNFNSFNVLMQNTQKPGANYSINTTINNLINEIRFYVDPVIDGYFDIALKNKAGVVLYRKNGASLERLPKFSTYTNSSVIVLEKDYISNKYSNRLIIVSNDGIIYNSDYLLPISIQNVELNTNNSIFIKYDNKMSKYRFLIVYDDKFCRLEDDSEEIVNYEFTISYDHANKTFTQLEFVNIGLAKDGCDRVNEILEESQW